MLDVASDGRFLTVSLAAVSLRAENGSGYVGGGGGGGGELVDAAYGVGECENAEQPDYALTYYLYVYIGSFVLALGCVGHLVTIAALLGSRQLRRQSLSPFLLVMSASGLLALLAGLLPHVVELATCERTRLGDLDPSTDFGCRLLQAARYYGLHLYSWTEALVAAERAMAVPFVSHGYDDSYFCNLVDRGLYESWPYAHLAIYCLAPVVVMLPSNALTLVTMRNSEFDSATLRKAKPVTVMMLALNCVFLVTAAPFMVVEFVRTNGSTAEQFAVAEVVVIVFRLALYAGSASTIFVYAIMAAKFRKTLRRFAARSIDRLASVLSLPPVAAKAARPVARTERSMSCPNGVVTRCSPSPHTQQEQWTTIG